MTLYKKAQGSISGLSVFILVYFLPPHFSYTFPNTTSCLFKHLKRDQQYIVLHFKNIIRPRIQLEQIAYFC